MSEVVTISPLDIKLNSVAMRLASLFFVCDKALDNKLTFLSSSSIGST